MEGPSSSDLSGAELRAPLPVLAALLDAESDADALERMLLAFAQHPQGAGFERAWVVLWNARTGLLEGWRERPAGGAGGTLGAELGRARRAPGPEADRVAIRAWAESPDRLEGALAAAWRGSTCATGSGSDSPGAPWSDAARIGVIALRRGARAYGLLVGAWSAGAGEPAATSALETLRVAADAAFTAQARAADLRRRARQAAAAAELAHAAISAINVAEAMHLLARLAAQGVGVRGAAVYRAAAQGAPPEVAVAFGSATSRERIAEDFREAAGSVIAGGQARSGERGDAPGLPEPAAHETTLWAAVPIAAYGRVLGALVVHDGLDRHPAATSFERGDLEFLGMLADQAALLLDGAERTEALRLAERNVRDLDARVRDLDARASVGELAVRVAQEARNPLAAIAAFTRRAQRDLTDEDPRREYLEVVLREHARLEAMLAEQQQYAGLERPRLAMQSLNAVVQAALQRSSETLVRRRVRLLKKLAPDLPPLLLDAARIRRVVENVVAYGLECVSLGGRLQVSSRRAGGFVVVEVAHDGAGHGTDLMEQLSCRSRPARSAAPRSGSRWPSRSSASTAARCGCAAKASGARCSRSRCRSRATRTAESSANGAPCAVIGGAATRRESELRTLTRAPRAC